MKDLFNEENVRKYLEQFVQDDRSEITNWLQTYSGKKFDQLNPRVEDIDIEDIAHALSMFPRYNGHTYFPFSVAQHCVIVSHLVPEEFALRALLHDAPEAYVGDITRPLKKIIGPLYRMIEDNVMEVVAKRFNLPQPYMPEEIDFVDKMIVIPEKLALFPDDFATSSWRYEGNPFLHVQIEEITWREAKAQFLQRFEFLVAQQQDEELT